METKRRMPICRIMSEQQRKWLDNNCCPSCGLPKKEWKRRTDWTCCSKECSKRYSKECFRVWQYWKLNAFRRDKFECVKCGFKSRKEIISIPEDERYYEINYLVFGRVEFGNDLKLIIGDESQLIADHIIPIAIGGEEYDLDNVQTLCIKCNKIKTKEDLKKIALYRKQDITQTKLNRATEDLVSIPPNPKGIGYP